MTWSGMFKIMETVRKDFNVVEDYSISETTLEQVFISFAKQQKSAEEKQLKDEGAENENEPYFHQKSLVRYMSNAERSSGDYSKF